MITLPLYIRICDSFYTQYGITNPLQYVDSWEIVPMSLKKKVFLGEGKFGDVYSGVFQGVMKGKRENDNEEVEVFVETLRGNQNMKGFVTCGLVTHFKLSHTEQDY